MSDEDQTPSTRPGAPRAGKKPGKSQKTGKAAKAGDGNKGDRDKAVKRTVVADSPTVFSAWGAGDPATPTPATTPMDALSAPPATAVPAAPATPTDADSAASAPAAPAPAVATLALATVPAATAPAEVAAPVQPGGPRLPAAWTLAAGAAAVVLAVLLVVSLVALGHRDGALGQREALDGARASALTTARADMLVAAAYDYHHLSADFAAVVARSTLSFGRQFDQASRALARVLTEYKTAATARIVAAGLVSATTTHAVALVFVEQTITNSLQKKPSKTDEVAELSLVRQRGRWLIADLTLL